MADETSEPMTDNAALNSMVDELVAINDSLANHYAKVAGDGNFIAIDDTHPRIRGAMPLAVKTVVTNKGPNQVEVRENGVLCAIVAANKSLELPMAGTGPLNLRVAAGQTANAAIATYTKNA